MIPKSKWDFSFPNFPFNISYFVYGMPDGRRNIGFFVSFLFLTRSWFFAVYIQSRAFSSMFNKTFILVDILIQSRLLESKREINVN